MSTAKTPEPGDLVWIESIKTGDPKTDSSYYDGEYLVLRAAPTGSVTVVKPTAGYGGHQTKSFSARTHTIEWLATDEAFVREFADDLDEFAATPVKDRNWVASVYGDTKGVARMVRRILDARWPEQAAWAPLIPAELFINGVRYVAVSNPTQEVTA